MTIFPKSCKNKIDKVGHGKKGMFGIRSEPCHFLFCWLSGKNPRRKKLLLIELKNLLLLVELSLYTYVHIDIHF